MNGTEVCGRKRVIPCLVQCRLSFGKLGAAIYRDIQPRNASYNSPVQAGFFTIFYIHY